MTGTDTLVRPANRAVQHAEEPDHLVCRKHPRYALCGVPIEGPINPVDMSAAELLCPLCGAVADEFAWRCPVCLREWKAP